MPTHDLWQYFFHNFIFSPPPLRNFEYKCGNHGQFFLQTIGIFTVLPFLTNDPYAGKKTSCLRIVVSIFQLFWPTCNILKSDIYLHHLLRTNKQYHTQCEDNAQKKYQHRSGGPQKSRNLILLYHCVCFQYILVIYLACFAGLNIY